MALGRKLPPIPGTIRVLVCGGRDFDDTVAVSEALDRLHRERGFDVVIEGGARGADYQAKMWAKMNEIAFEEYRADWEKHGRAAGPIRNKQMLDEGKPDLVVAFPGGLGTANMIRQAEARGIEVVQPLTLTEPSQ